MNFGLRSQTAIVTGAAAGIGRATALALASAGARIAIVDRDTAGMEVTARAIRDGGGACEAFAFDFLAYREIGKLVEAILDQLGPIHILVNAAGISDGGQTLFETDDDTWERVHTIDLRSPFILLREVARHMVARGGGGKIVNVSSSSAHRRDMVSPIYGSAKAGLDLLTRSAAGELGQYDINVNSVAPGFTRTAIVANAPDSLVKQGPLANMLGRVSEPEDVANTIVFLCSPASRQITGQVIHTSAGNVT